MPARNGTAGLRGKGKFIQLAGTFGYRPTNMQIHRFALGPEEPEEQEETAEDMSIVRIPNKHDSSSIEDRNSGWNVYRALEIDPRVS